MSGEWLPKRTLCEPIRDKTDSVVASAGKKRTSVLLLPICGFPRISVPHWTLRLRSRGSTAWPSSGCTVCGLHPTSNCKEED
jgi:hypothetical protein